MAAESAVAGISPLRAARSMTALSGAAWPSWILLWISANSALRSATSPIDGRTEGHRAVPGR